MAGRARGLSAVRRLPRHRQPADQQLGGIRDAARDGRVAASFASVGRQTDTSLGVAISGAIVEPALARGAAAFTGAEHAVWWLVLGLGAGILILGLLSTGRWALGTAARATALFEGVDGVAPTPRERSLNGKR